MAIYATKIGRNCMRDNKMERRTPRMTAEYFRRLELEWLHNQISNRHYLMACCERLHVEEIEAVRTASSSSGTASTSVRRSGEG
jgi:hypothetical protein